MAERQYLAIDLGAESGRVMLGTVSDRGIALTEIHRFTNGPVQVPGGALCWDIRRLWDEIKIGLGKGAEQVGAGEIAGIGVDTWGVDFALLDSRGELLGDPVCYRDPRTKGMEEAVFARISRERVYSITGIQTLPINTLFQLASLSFSGSKELAAAKHLLFVPDLISYWLSGKMGTEYTIGSTSQMVDARTREFSGEILRAIGVEAELFSPIEMPGVIRGEVLPGVNAALAGVPVIAVGAHDTASAVMGVPAEEGNGDWLYLSSGTWSLLGAEVEEPVLTEKAAAYNITNEGGVGGKIRLLKNIPGMWLVQECRRAWAKEGREYGYEELTALAAGAARGMAVLDLGDAVFASPGEMPGKILEHCRRTRQRGPGTVGEFVRVILESLAARYAEVVRELEEVTGKRFRVLHVVGGGSRNDLLNQMAADATGLVVLAGPVEATALGNILAQGMATGAVAGVAAGRGLVGRSFPVRRFEPGGGRRG